jgi:hypothetical protein
VERITTAVVYVLIAEPPPGIRSAASFGFRSTRPGSTSLIRLPVARLTAPRWQGAVDPLELLAVPGNEDDLVAAPEWQLARLIEGYLTTQLL